MPETVSRRSASSSRTSTIPMTPPPRARRSLAAKRIRQQSGTSRFAQRTRGVERGRRARREERAGERGRDGDGDSQKDVRRTEVEECRGLEGEVRERGAGDAIDDQAADT